MSGRRWMVVISMMVGLTLTAPALAAPNGERIVARKLQRYGELDQTAAKRVARAVSKRMGKSAGNFAPPNDALRVAGSRALFGRDRAPTDVDAAKLRLRLFAGASEWALGAFFKPRPGCVRACRQTFSLRQGECEALVAAAGSIPVAEARRLGAGSSRGRRVAAASRRPAPSKRATGGSRFSRYDSGFRSSSPSAGRAAPAKARQRSTAFAAARPSPRQAPRRARPVVTRRPQAQAPQMSTKEAYKARREAYLARQRAKLEAKKAEREARQAAKSAPPPAEEDEPAAAPASAPSASDLGLERAAPKPKGKKEQPLDNDFLDGLLDDPLGDS